ncbi:MAG: carbon storage regulator [Pirellula sp.]|jgi:carbon storage regulator CsrA
MLILGRKADQSIVFPSCGITIRILQVNGRVAKIGIAAPEKIAIARGEVLNQYEPSVNVDSQNETDSLSRFRTQLEEVRNLRERGFDDKSDRLLERILLELNSLDRSAAETANSVSEAATSYAINSRENTVALTPALLFVGSPALEYEDDLQIMQRRTNRFTAAADCQAVDFLVKAEQSDCIIFDMESCGPNISSKIKELRAGLEQRPKIICISQYAPSIYGFDLLRPAFDGWIWKPWDYDRAWTHIQTVLRPMPQEA